MTAGAAGLYEDARPDDGADRLPVPDRALAVGAHPDDIEFGCGGTLAKWAAAGADVTVMVMTDGSKGTWDRTLEPDELVAARAEEQGAAAAALGAARAVLLGHVDGELAHTRELVEDLCLRIRTLRPGVLITHDPWRRYELHPDHRATGWAVLDAVVAARDHLFFPDQLEGGVEPHRPETLLLWRADEPDYWEDVWATIDAKVAALLCHSSQTQTTMGDALRDDEAEAAFRSRIIDWARTSGEPAGLAAAEAFKRLAP